MASTGKFYPFNRYINDIALLMDGSHKIIPSKYILLKTLKNKDQDASTCDDGTIQSHNATVLPISSTEAPTTNTVSPPEDWSQPDEVVSYVNSIFDLNNAQTLEEINYQSARFQVLDFILNQMSTPNEEVTKTNTETEKYYIGGDINFISHDVYDGMLYSEIYLHVPNDAGRYRMQVNNTNQKQDVVVLTDPQKPEFDAGKTYSFQGVLLFYNIYKTGSDEPFACDIPLGVFVLFAENGSINSQKLIIQSDELLGNGTAWSTRICSRFVSSAAIKDKIKDKVPINTGQSDYSTLTSLLSEFGKAIKIMEKNISSREEDILTIKSYLDDFKHYQTVNVPYVLGDWWYVNGKPIKHVDELELLISQGNQYSWTSTQDMTWSNEDTTILDYIEHKKLTTFLRKCLSDEKNGRFEGINGVVCIDVTNKVLTIECKSADQTTKIFKTYNIELGSGKTTTYEDNIIKIGKDDN